MRRWACVAVQTIQMIIERVRFEGRGSRHLADYALQKLGEVRVELLLLGIRQCAVQRLKSLHAHNGCGVTEQRTAFKETSPPFLLRGGA